MKLIVIICLFFQFNCFAGYELAIISDADGFTFVRSSPKIGNNKTDSVPNGTIVWLSENEGNWISIEYQNNSQPKNGFIYKDRVELLSSYSKYKTVSILANSKILNLGVDTVFIKTKKVKENEIVITYNSKVDARPLWKGRDFWGTDGGMPRLSYESIIFVHDTSKYFFPKFEYENLFQANLEYTECYLDSKSKKTYLVAHNSDGAGGYVAIWVICKLENVQTIVIIPF